MRIEMRKQIAGLTSNIFNPFLLGLIIILVLSFESTSGILDALKWSLILIAISIIPVFLFVVYLVRNGKLDGIFANVRRQRTGIYLLAGVCAIVGGIIITYFGAPLALLAVSVAGLSAVIVFVCINFLWKISIHIAFVAASVTVLVILYGPIAALSLVLLPLVAWARIELGHHSLAQVAVGASLAALIVVVVFYLFGLL